MRKEYSFSLRSSESLIYICSSFQSNKGLSVSKENAGKVTQDKADIHEAISWYNQALGFHVEAGHGKWEKLLSLEQSYILMYIIEVLTIEDLVVLLFFLQELNSHSPTLMQKGLHANFHSRFTMEMTSTHVSNLYTYLFEASFNYILVFTKVLVTQTVYNHCLI